MLTLKVAPGIGDISWVLQKLWMWKERPEIQVLIAKENPHRSHQLSALVPWVEGFEYGDFETREVLERGGKTRLLDLKNGDEAFIEVNTHLESGKRLEDWQPELGTSYDYPLNIMDRAELITMGYEDYFCVFPGSEATEKAYSIRGGWSKAQWRELCENLQQVAPVFVIGAEWDDSMVTYITEGLTRTEPIIGKSLYFIFALIKQSRHFYSFPSGLGTMSDLIGARCTMFMPTHLEKMIGTWNNPENRLNYHVQLFPKTVSQVFENGELALGR